MARVKIRLNVVETDDLYDVYIETDADPSSVAAGIAKELGLTSPKYSFRISDSFVIREGTVLDFVPESGGLYKILGKAGNVSRGAE